MAITQESVQLSRRAGKIFSFLDDVTRESLRPVILNADSFDALPQWAKEIITDTEKKYNIFTK